MSTFPLLHSTRVPPFAWAVAGALLATTLDLVFASVYWAALHDLPPVRVMQTIAAYWGLGRDAYAGGIATAALGAALFFARMVLLAVIYLLAARRYTTLIERPYTWGSLFGLAIYFSNKYLVVPLIGSMPQSASVDTDTAWMYSCIVAHMLLIGIPLALFARSSARDD